MEFKDVPEGVITGNFLPLFSLNDLLRLRRVSKPLKTFVDDHIRLRVLSSEREILITSKDGYDFDVETGTYQKCISMSTLLGLDVPIPHTRFHIKFPKKAIEMVDTPWTALEILKFAGKYGAQVTHLRVTALTVPLKPGAQIEFLCALASLTHLTIDNLILTPASTNNPKVKVKVKDDEQKRNKNLLIPESFKDIQEIKVGTFHTPVDTKAARSFYWQLIFACSNPQMTNFAHPGYLQGGAKAAKSEGDGDDEDDYDHGFHAYCFDSMEEMFGVCEKEEPFASGGWKEITKFYDLQNLANFFDEDIIDDFILSGGSCRLVELCVEYNVMLLNMPAAMLESVVIPEILEKSGGCVKSMRNFCFTCFIPKFPFLTEIRVQTDQCGLTDAGLSWNTMSPVDFGALEKMAITINSADLRDGLPCSDLFLVFFARKMQNLEELRIKFEPPDGTQVNVPKTKLILSACPNVTRLSLKNWQGTNKQISQLWSGLPKLEVVTLDKCKDLGNVGFVGEDKENPTFLGLKNLRKLWLRGIDQMPKITDTAFHLVFRHKKLREFYLVCSTPETKIHSITEDGIKSLLTGEFAASVERFPFEGWTLANKTKSQMKSLRDQFRVSHLI